MRGLRVEGSKARSSPGTTSKSSALLRYSAELTAVDDQPGGPQVIVCSHRAWSLHFESNPGGTQPHGAGETGRRSSCGVMPEGFRGPAASRRPTTGRRSRALASSTPPPSRRTTRQATLASSVAEHGHDARGRRWRSYAVGTSRRREMKGLPARRTQTSFSIEGGHRPDLDPGVMLQFTPLFFAFGLILLIGCANVAEVLLLARAVSRQREDRSFGSLLVPRGATSSFSCSPEVCCSHCVSAALAFGPFCTARARRHRLCGDEHIPAPDTATFDCAVPPADRRVALFLLAGAIVLDHVVRARAGAAGDAAGTIVGDSRPGDP